MVYSLWNQSFSAYIIHNIWLNVLYTQSFYYAIYFFNYLILAYSFLTMRKKYRFSFFSYTPMLLIKNRQLLNEKEKEAGGIKNSSSTTHGVTMSAPCPFAWEIRAWKSRPLHLRRPIKRNSPELCPHTVSCLLTPDSVTPSAEQVYTCSFFCMHHSRFMTLLYVCHE